MGLFLFVHAKTFAVKTEAPTGPRASRLRCFYQLFPSQFRSHKSIDRLISAMKSLVCLRV